MKVASFYGLHATGPQALGPLLGPQALGPEEGPHPVGPELGPQALGPLLGPHPVGPQALGPEEGPHPVADTVFLPSRSAHPWKTPATAPVTAKDPKVLRKSRRLTPFAFRLGLSAAPECSLLLFGKFTMMCFMYYYYNYSIY